MELIRKCAIGVFLLAALLYNVVASTALADDTTSAKAAFVMDMRSGRVLFAVNEDVPLPMASTTKVMTALLALENGDLNAMVETSVNAYGRPGTSIYLGLGERLTLEQMLYGLMLASGNDAAVAIAEHIGGSVDGFLAMMNERAVTLGAKSTHFANPNGLPVADHYTSAKDLTLIAAEAMKNPFFRDIVSTQRASIPWEGRDYMRVLRNKNALLSDYEGATGIKTGFTRAAGRCLVFGAKRDDMDIVGVVLNCSNWFDEAARIMDICFSRYTWVIMMRDGTPVGTVPTKDADTDSVEVMLRGDLAAPALEEEMPEMRLELPDSITAPQPSGAQVGWATMYIGDTVVDRRPLVLAEPLRAAQTSWQKWIAGWPLLK